MIRIHADATVEKHHAPFSGRSFPGQSVPTHIRSQVQHFACLFIQCRDGCQDGGRIFTLTADRLVSFHPEFFFRQVFTDILRVFLTQPSACRTAWKIDIIVKDNLCPLFPGNIKNIGIAFEIFVTQISRFGPRTRFTCSPLRTGADRQNCHPTETGKAFRVSQFFLDTRTGHIPVNMPERHRTKFFRWILKVCPQSILLRGTG